MKVTCVKHSQAAMALAFCAGLAVMSAGTLTAAPMPDTSKMNLLFIIVEDWNAGTPGCYGNPICRTPNLDRFADSAVRFDSAYVQAVCCNPSRTSFLTRPTVRTTGGTSESPARIPRIRAP